jgi:hypothetical protein
MQLGQAVRASVQSIFLRCLRFKREKMMRLYEGIAYNFRHKIRPLEANLVKKFGVKLHARIGKLEPFKAMRLFFHFFQ